MRGCYSTQWGILLFLAASLTVPRAAGAVDFIRGDVNSDGAVSIADSAALAAHLYKEGAAPECRKAADADDDGLVSITDSLHILQGLFSGGPTPCLPFPQAGSDPTPDTLECGSYGSGSPLEDSAARIDIDDAVIGEDGRAIIVVRVSNGTAISGCSGTISIAGGVLANSVTPRIKAIFTSFPPGYLYANVRGEQLHFGFIGSFVNASSFLPPGENEALFTITACIDTSTDPGNHAMVLEAGQLIDDASSRAISPLLGGGTLTVPAGVVLDPDCYSRPDDPQSQCSDEPASSEGTPFIRGDANDDKNVSFADANLLSAYFFRGGAPPVCMKAADVDDNGAVETNDLTFLLSYLIREGPQPCHPHKFEQLDPTPDSLECPAYGGGSILRDPTSIVRVDDVVPDPDGTVLITIRLTNPVPVSGFLGVLGGMGPDLIAHGQHPEVTDLLGISEGGFLDARVDQGTLFFGCMTSFTEPVVIPPGENVPVLQLRVCLLKGVRPGFSYFNFSSVDLVESSTSRLIYPAFSEGTMTVLGLPAGAGCDNLPITNPGRCTDPPPPNPAPGVDFSRGDVNRDGKVSISDALMLRDHVFSEGRAPGCFDTGDIDDDGVLSWDDFNVLLRYLFRDAGGIPAPHGAIGPDPTPDSLSCRYYVVDPPEETDDIVRLGNVEGAPGMEVEIPVFLSNAVPVVAFQLIVEYDPALFSPREDLHPLAFGDTFYGDYWGSPLGFVGLKALPADGVFRLGYVPSLAHSFEVPAGADRLIFKILGTVAPNAPPGTEIVLTPTNGPEGEGLGVEGLKNELTHRGNARYVSIVPLTLPGILKIVPDLAIFRRGDSNGDDKVDISDAQSTLSYLFLGGLAPSCHDAADTNDDGKVDISDPVMTLYYLFLGLAALPAPHPGPGEDPTQDGLECSFRDA